MSLFAARHVNAEGSAFGAVRDLIRPYIRTRAKRVLFDAIRKELVGNPSHGTGFALPDDLLETFRRSGVRKRDPLPPDLLREVEDRLAGPIARKWHALLKKLATAKQGRLSPDDLNEAMLPRLTYGILSLLMQDSMHCVGYPQRQLDGTERHSYIPDVTIYDGWENRALRRLRHGRRRRGNQPLPDVMLRWLAIDGLEVEFVGK